MSAPPPKPFAFVTLLTSSSYLPGALVLSHSLADLHPAPREVEFSTVCLVTPETVDVASIKELRKAFDLVIGVEVIASGSNGQAGLELMNRSDLSQALTKLHIFRLHALFSRIVYLDADTLPLRPISHLFNTVYDTTPRGTKLRIAASPDTGWPDCFNSGVLVVDLEHGQEDWNGLMALLDPEGQAADGESGSNGSFDGADQGLLNEWFSEEGGGGGWQRLKFTYNTTPSSAYTYAPAYKRYGNAINIVHFIGPHKPWNILSSRPARAPVPESRKQAYDYPALIDRWFSVYDAHCRPSSDAESDSLRRFQVPETIAIWNQPSALTFAQQPVDRLGLEELKQAAEAGLPSTAIGGVGSYTSMPLAGRLDLMRPHHSPPKSPARPLSPSIASSPVVQAITPLPHTPQSAPPQTSHWDAQFYAPPANAGPEMATPMDAVYANAWDEQGGLGHQPPFQTDRGYPVLPDHVKQDAWYQTYTSTTPDRANIAPVFPWEKPDRVKPGRVFPPGDSPPLYQPSAGKPSSPPNELAVPVIEAQAPTPTTSPPPTRGMADAIATYHNAWDGIPQIQQYATRLAGVSGSSFRQRGQSSTSGQSTPRAAIASPVEQPESRNHEIDHRSDESRDGDDEDDDAPSPKPRFRERAAQTDQPQLADAKVQAVPGGGPSPAVKTIDLPTDRSISTSASTQRGGGRVWDPNTDVDVRRRDTQEVLSRLMRSGGVSQPQSD